MKDARQAADIRYPGKCWHTQAPTVRHKYIQTSHRPAKVKKSETSKLCFYKVT